MKTKSHAILMFFVLFAVGGCHYNSLETPKTEQAAATPEDANAAFQNDVRTMETANLKYVLTFRRFDGGAFDAEDKSYLRTNLPTTNRVILSDGGKAYIVGTNYKFPPENLEVLRLRFKIEDFSSGR